jgi:hypothetical protein
MAKSGPFEFLKKRQNTTQKGISIYMYEKTLYPKGFCFIASAPLDISDKASCHRWRFQDIFFTPATTEGDCLIHRHIQSAH